MPEGLATAVEGSSSLPISQTVLTRAKTAFSTVCPSCSEFRVSQTSFHHPTLAHLHTWQTSASRRFHHHRTNVPLAAPSVVQVTPVRGLSQPAFLHRNPLDADCGLEVPEARLKGQTHGKEPERRGGLR